MAIHIILGFQTSSNESEPENLYTGRDADKARAAAAKYQGAITKWIRNPKGNTKINESIASEKDARIALAAIQAVPAKVATAEDAQALEIERLRAENERLQKDVEDLEQIQKNAVEDSAGSYLLTLEETSPEEGSEPDPEPEKDEPAKKKTTSRRAGPKKS